MTVSVLRTAEGWWVQKDGGAVKVDTAAATTGELLADRGAVEAAPAKPHRRGGCSRTAVAGHRAVPGGGADDQFRLPRTRRGDGSQEHSADLLPQVVGLHQRAGRSHRQAGTCAVPGL